MSENAMLSNSPPQASRGDGPIRWGDFTVPATSRREVSPVIYTDLDRFGREVEIMRQSWQIACHVSEVPRPGDATLFEAFGESVAVVRQHDGSLAAWHNVCQHRGTRLLCENVSGAKRFVCPYHHWTYALDGRLIGVPERQNFEPRQLEDINAPPVRVEERHGWVWVNLGAEGAPLAEALGEVDQEIASYPMAAGVLLEPMHTFEMNANWKRCIEAFIELYHAPFLHRETIPEGSVDFGRASYALFERNSMFVYPDTAKLGELESTRDHQRYAHCHYSVYPNTCFNLNARLMMVYRYVPVSVDRTFMHLWLVRPDDIEASPASDAMICDYTHRVFGEDVFICGEQGKTARSAGNRVIRLGDEECRIAHLLDALERDLERGHVHSSGRVG